MKKILLTTTLYALMMQPGCAEGFGYKHIDSGYFYTNATLPITAAKYEGALDAKTTEKLKVGKASKSNILKLVEMGDAGINAAAKNGNITKVHYVDVKKEKVFIPLLFFPIYVGTTTTTVYGE